MSFNKIIKRTLLSLGVDVKRTISQSSLESHLLAVFRTYEIDLVIDVGANTGQYGQKLRSIGYRGQIMSFEPLTVPYIQLDLISRSDGNWSAINIALGEKMESKFINVHKSTVFSSLLQMNEFGLKRFSDAQSVESESIEIDTLDNHIKLINNFEARNIFLKLDTQGYDLKVLGGAQEALKRCRAIQSEISFRQIYDGMPTYRESLDVFVSSGFMVSGMFPVSRNSDLSIIEADCVLVKNYLVP